MKHNDVELIQDILEGDDHAFSLLVGKYQKPVHALAWRIVGDFHIAEEITQDSFLIAYKRLKTLKEPQRFLSWMYVITRHRCMAWLRKKRLWTQSIEHLEQTDNERLEEAIYSEYVVAEKERTVVETQREVVKKLLAKLQESERTVMTLHYFGEMSCSEIGEFLGVSANTIKSRLRRARERLKKEEPMIREALEHFKITPNLTENIMREISQTKPAAPSASKPFVPWLFAASTVVVVLLMLGIGNSKYLTRFQKPYSFDANSEIKIDIIEAPIMADLALKSNVRRQLESANVQTENLVHQQKPNGTPQSTEAGEENNMENYPQWNLPKEAKMRLGKGGMREIQFSPDGTQFAVRSTIGVWLYDVETCKEISLFPEIQGTFVFSADGRFLTSEKGMWEIATGRKISQHDALPDVEVAWFLKDCKTFVSMGKAKDTISILNFETGQRTTTKIGERPGYAHENYALTEDKIAIGSRDGSLEVWDIRTGKKLSTIREQTEKRINFRLGGSQDNHSTSLAFSPDGAKLASGNLDGTVQIWDAITGGELIVLNKKMDKIKRLFHSPDGGKILTHEPWEGDNISRPTTLEFSPDENILAIGNANSSIQLWNIATSEVIATFTGHTSKVYRLAFSPDGNTLASGSADGTVRFWNIKTKEPHETGIAGHAWIRTASFREDNFKLASVSSDGIVTAWDLKNFQKTTHKTKKTLEIPRYWGSYVSLVLSPDGTKLLSRGLEDDSSNPNFGNYVARLIDVNTGRELAAFPDDNEKVFSPDGKTIAGVRGNRIFILNTESGEKRKIITSDHDEDSDDKTHHINTLGFSPDGKKLVSGNIGGQVQMWDVETGVALASFFEEQPSNDNEQTYPIRSIAFTSDGLLLAVRDRNKIRLLGSSKQIHFKEVSVDAKLFDDTLLFSPDNSVLLTKLYNGRIQLFEVSTGDILTTLDGHTNMVEALKFSHDGETLISVGGGTILFWDWDEVITNARGKDQERKAKVNPSTQEESTENVLQFVERSSQEPKSANHALTLAEVYLANEWYEEALERYKRNLYITTSRTYSTPKGDLNLIASPKLERKLFTQIARASKNVRDKDGYANMLNQLIDLAPDRLNIQLNSHLILAKFYGANGPLEKADEHIQKTESIIENIPPDKLQTQLDAHFTLAEFYRDHGTLEKADEHIQKTGFVTENAWVVLGPFDNAGGIGYNTAYIPEDTTEINLAARYDGLDGPVSWKKFTDAELDGYIHLGEKNVDWHVSYAFATVTSPDEREVQFRFDSDDQGKVWLNGKEVFSHTKAFMAIIDTYTIPVTLKPGKNSILIKVCNEEGGWAFYLRITDSDGKPFDDLIIHSSEEN